MEWESRQPPGSKPRLSSSTPACLTSRDIGAPSIRSNEQLSDLIMPLLSRKAGRRVTLLPPCIHQEGWLEQEQGQGPRGQESSLVPGPLEQGLPLSPRQGRMGEGQVEACMGN